MDDAFLFFGLERRPLVDAIALKEKYLQGAASRHPDVSSGENERFHQLQEAYGILRDPVARLRHLRDLQFAIRDEQNGAMPDADLFLKTSRVIQAAKAVWSRAKGATSAVARAAGASEAAEILPQVREALEAVRESRARLEADLRGLDQRWPEVDAAELTGLASSFMFLSKWTSELSEWEFRLAHE
jgi:curved DNA-binding protein CbpA